MRHKWNEGEDRTIARYIVLYDTPRAFKKYSEDFGVTEKSVASRYYRNRKYIDLLTYYQRGYEYATIPLKKWYERLWESVKKILNIFKKSI